MTMYRLSLAVLCGLGLSALAPLLLRGPLWIAIPAAFLLFPGGFIAAILFHSDSPFIVMASNAFVYSGLSYVFLAAKRNVNAPFLRLASIRSVIPVAVLVGLACIPTLDPLLPRGLVELKRQESALQNDLPDDVGIEQARSVLRSKSIQFYESQRSTGVVLQREGTTMVASDGDRLIHSRFQTNAGQFPCRYDMEVDLLFDASGRLKQRYIHRFRVCL
jgi:hypothetical protein